MRDHVTLLKILLITLLLAYSSRSASQIISNIRHEPFQGKVLITYSVNGLTPQQRMAVSVYCSDDKFKTELKSVSGNGVGDNVYGNSEKTVFWEVLKDRSQLVGNISFEIRGLVFNDRVNQEAGFAARDTVLSSAEERKNA